MSSHVTTIWLVIAIHLTITFGKPIIRGNNSTTHPPICSESNITTVGCVTLDDHTSKSISNQSKITIDDHPNTNNQTKKSVKDQTQKPTTNGPTTNDDPADSDIANRFDSYGCADELKTDIGCVTYSTQTKPVEEPDEYEDRSAINRLEYECEMDEVKNFQGKCVKFSKVHKSETEPPASEEIDYITIPTNKSTKVSSHMTTIWIAIATYLAITTG